MTCKICDSDNVVLKSVIRQGKIIEGCEKCINTTQHATEFQAKHTREAQKKNFRRDLTQPINGREFSRAYPEKARELYGDELFRKLS